MKAWHLLVIALSLAIGACGLFDLAEVDFDVVTDTDVKGAGEGAEETFTDEFCLKDYSGDIDKYRDKLKKVEYGQAVFLPSKVEPAELAGSITLKVTHKATGKVFLEKSFTDVEANKVYEIGDLTAEQMQAWSDGASAFSSSGGDCFEFEGHFTRSDATEGAWTLEGILEITWRVTADALG